MPTRNKRNKSAKSRNYKRKSIRRQKRNRRYYKGGTPSGLSDFLTIDDFLKSPVTTYELKSKPEVILDGVIQGNEIEYANNKKNYKVEQNRDGTYKVTKKSVVIKNGKFTNVAEKQTFYETYKNNSLFDATVM